jgi:uncharacterized CHY-type Zn-finger protein
MDATTTEELIECDECPALMTEAQYDASSGMCPACHALRFECSECKEVTLKSDAHATIKSLCGACGDERVEAEYSAALEGAGDELQALVDELTGAEDLVMVRKAITALKRLAK